MGFRIFRNNLKILNGFSQEEIHNYFKTWRES
jgi:hypothetical protein